MKVGAEQGQERQGDVSQKSKTGGCPFVLANPLGSQGRHTSRHLHKKGGGSSKWRAAGSGQALEEGQQR